MAWKAYIDGGSRGNPGPAAAGVVLIDSSGKIVFAAGFFLGKTTNNQAEYTAFIKALQLLSKARVDKVTMYSDSELLVHQINGVYRVKNPGLKPLFEQAQQLLETFTLWKVEHVYREQNAHADKLANQAMDKGRDLVLTDTKKLMGKRVAKVQSSKAGRTHNAVEVFVIKGPAKATCSAGIKRGQLFVFERVIPQGLCIEGCATVLDAVLAIKDIETSKTAPETTMTARCTKNDCGAVFEIRQKSGN